MIVEFDINKFILIGRVMIGYEWDNTHGGKRTFKIFFKKTPTISQTAYSFNILYFKTWFKFTIWIKLKTREL